MNVIQSHHHEVFTEQLNKIALSADDDQRIILPGRIQTFAHAFQGWGQTERPKETQRDPGKDTGPWGGEFQCYFWEDKDPGVGNSNAILGIVEKMINKQTKKRAGPLNPHFPTTDRTSQNIYFCCLTLTKNNWVALLWHYICGPPCPTLYG